MAKSSRSTIEFPSFTPFASGHVSAEDKKRFAAALIRFIEGGFPRSQFTSGLYRCLSNAFSHIAHCNLEGFFGTWFSTVEQQLEWVTYILRHPCHGSPAYTYCDVEEFICDYALRTGLAARLEQAHAEAVRTAELSMLAHLRSKYPKAAAV